jgi:hypothetical protein
VGSSESGRFCAVDGVAGWGEGVGEREPEGSREGGRMESGRFTKDDLLAMGDAEEDAEGLRRKG